MPGVSPGKPGELFNGERQGRPRSAVPALRSVSLRLLETIDPAEAGAEGKQMRTLHIIHLEDADGNLAWYVYEQGGNLLGHPTIGLAWTQPFPTPEAAIASIRFPEAARTIVHTSYLHGTSTPHPPELKEGERLR